MSSVVGTVTYFFASTYATTKVASEMRNITKTLNLGKKLNKNLYHCITRICKNA